MINQNRCSRCTRITVHVQPEWVFTFVQNMQFLLAMGVLATIGQWVGVKALRLGEASVVGNIQYMQLIYAAVLGYFLFKEIPDTYTIVGATIIVGAAIYIFHRETLSKKTVSD